MLYTNSFGACLISGKGALHVRSHNIGAFDLLPIEQRDTRWVDIFAPRRQKAVDPLALSSYYIPTALEPVGYRKWGSACSRQQHEVSDIEVIKDQIQPNKSISSYADMRRQQIHLHCLHIIYRKLWRLLDVGKRGSACSGQQHEVSEIARWLKTRHNQTSRYLRTQTWEGSRST
jgi:hypothetical protein